MIAQESNSVVGVYYLTGVMETASGIKLNPDSTFEFFFSQGAMDREGAGTWSRDGKQIVLNSTSNNINGFELKESKFIKKSKAIIKISSDNEMLLSFVHISLSGLGPESFIQLDESGKAEFEVDKVDTINIAFELCPERVHQIVPENSADNFFLIQMQPQIFDVQFNNVTLRVSENALKGQHPLLEGSNFTYLK